MDGDSQGKNRTEFTTFILGRHILDENGRLEPHNHHLIAILLTSGIDVTLSYHGWPALG
jgi:hypothetical protein